MGWRPQAVPEELSTGPVLLAFPTLLCGSGGQPLRAVVPWFPREVASICVPARRGVRGSCGGGDWEGEAGSFFFLLLGLTAALIVAVSPFWSHLLPDRSLGSGHSTCSLCASSRGGGSSPLLLPLWDSSVSLLACPLLCHLHTQYPCMELPLIGFPFPGRPLTDAKSTFRLNVWMGEDGGGLWCHQRQRRVRRPCLPATRSQWKRHESAPRTHVIADRIPA